MNSETKNCQNCKKDFTIEPEDFNFYEKIKVPAPTWCPECRRQRRLIWRNERYLYKRACDLCNENTFSVYPSETIFPVYCYDCWISDKWDASLYSEEIDFSRPFFEQFKKLSNKMPHYALYNINAKRSGYCNISADLKDCYLLFGSWHSENCSYGDSVLESKDSFDNMWITKCERCFYLIDCENCYNTVFSQECDSCIDSWFLFSCRNCQNCLFCSNLQNKQFCIFNKQYSEKEYFEIIEKIKKHMVNMPYVDKKGRIFSYGEFFPYDMCPFGYNETSANDYFPIIKEEATKKGYPWKEREKRNYQITKESSKLPDSILNVEESILNETIACSSKDDQRSQCTTAFRIMPNELQFYRQKKLPLPRYCPNCRHCQRLKYRNPMRLYTRKCMKIDCQNKFQTTYAPNKLEIVYCEKCYQQEVY